MKLWPAAITKIGKKLRTFVCFLLLLIIWVVTAPILAQYLIVQSPIERADAIIVLSGSAEYIERSRHAAELFRLGIAPKIYLTDDGMIGGWDDALKRNPSWAERTRSELIDQQVKEDAIEVIPPIVHGGTYDEANAIVNFLMQQRQTTSVLLVTSAYHSRRALWTFKRINPKSSTISKVGIHSPPGVSIYTWWLSRQGWKSIGLEWIKTVYYHACY